MDYSGRSTTPYRWMSHAELIRALEAKIGKSPILDELLIRLDELDVDFDDNEALVESARDAFVGLLNVLDAKVVPEKAVASTYVVTGVQTLAIKCSTCEAEKRVQVDSYLLPE